MLTRLQHELRQYSVEVPEVGHGKDGLVLARGRRYTAQFFLVDVSPNTQCFICTREHFILSYAQFTPTTPTRLSC